METKVCTKCGPPAQPLKISDGRIDSEESVMRSVRPVRRLGLLTGIMRTKIGKKRTSRIITSNTARMQETMYLNTFQHIHAVFAVRPILSCLNFIRVGIEYFVDYLLKHR